MTEEPPRDAAAARQRPHDPPTWPDAPYHYGMGRIQAYDQWLASLSEPDRAQEISACKARYMAYYQQIGRTPPVQYAPDEEGMWRPVQRVRTFPPHARPR